MTLKFVLAPTRQIGLRELHIARENPKEWFVLVPSVDAVRHLRGVHGGEMCVLMDVEWPRPEWKDEVIAYAEQICEITVRYV